MTGCPHNFIGASTCENCGDDEGAYLRKLLDEKTARINELTSELSFMKKKMGMSKRVSDRRLETAKIADERLTKARREVKVIDAKCFELRETLKACLQPEGSHCFTCGAQPGEEHVACVLSSDAGRDTAEKIARMEKALEFYANGFYYRRDESDVDRDGGLRAREAISGKKNVEEESNDDDE